MRGTDLLCLLNMRKADATNARHADALMPATESMSVSLSMGTSLKFWSLALGCRVKTSLYPASAT